ncbi:putative iron-only hydrogenase system regulator [Salinivirga cyanobacteriivorans]|uniref:Putative iron-only hydrogenase system regulator n=1 Tax=Salinivirga cyanobacteriivorans TaxID=1307839 RepID=A0A0S2HW10_9BACT|nr:TM1266 family iron-only hydrogenase system putative regulator [Salinivirga cyanobacteriivorans]ALO14254.1 putative iron-only hydrogenase system regulator [Salinivirga cyanobacteriivorans]
MERRIGAAVLVIRDKAAIIKLNKIVSAHANIVIGRQGIPLQEKDINVITLVLEGSTDEIGSLTGQLGRLEGVQIKSALIKDEHYGS